MSNLLSGFEVSGGEGEERKDDRMSVKLAAKAEKNYGSCSISIQQETASCCDPEYQRVECK